MNTSDAVTVTAPTVAKGLRRLRDRLKRAGQPHRIGRVGRGDLSSFEEHLRRHTRVILRLTRRIEVFGEPKPLIEHTLVIINKQ